MDTAVDIGTAGLCDLAQWSLNSVEDICQDARGKGDRHWSSGSGYDLARADTGRLLVNLNDRVIGFQTDDLADEVVLADIDHLIHCEARISFQMDDRAVDSVNNTCFTHLRCLLPQGLNQNGSFLLPPQAGSEKSCQSGYGVSE